MRNLKRALSLVLAVVMVIGLMVVGASAVSYNDLTDKDEIVNKDAVSMLVALDIIQGKPDGSYAPTENVDRAQMAKMISVIMNKGVDNSALYENVNSGLTDIDGNWAKGHINYCYTNGVIAGRGNNTFDPSATVTALEAAKMLLVAVGYDPSIEGFVGTDWALNVSSMADAQGIFRNFTKDLTAPLNRDDAALLIYNALDVEMIQQYQNGYALTYADHRTILSDKYGVIKVEGVVTANEWAILDDDSETALREGKTRIENAEGIFSTTTNTQVINDADNVRVGTFNVSTPVDMLGKEVTMYIKKATILADSTVYGDPVVSDGNTVIETGDRITGGDRNDDNSMASLLRGTGLATDKDTEYYLNYEEVTPELDKDGEPYINVKGAACTIIDNDNDGTVDYVISVEKTLTHISAVSSRNETTTLYNIPGDDEIDNDEIVTSDDLAKDDVVLYVQYGGRTYVEIPETITGEMESYNSTNTDPERNFIRVGGTEYRADDLEVAETDELLKFVIEDCDTSKGVQFDATYDFFLDDFGNIVGYREVEGAPTQYALVLDSAYSINGLRTTGDVKILMADGTEATYAVDMDATADKFADMSTEDGKSAIEQWYATMNKDGETKITEDNAKKAVLAFMGSDDISQVSKGDKGYAAGNLIAYTIDEDTDEITFQPANLDLGAWVKGNAIDDYDDIGASGTFFNVDQPHNVALLNRDLENGDVDLVYKETVTGKTGNYGIDNDTIIYYYNGSEGSVVKGYDNMAKLIDMDGNTEKKGSTVIDGNGNVKVSAVMFNDSTDVAEVIVVYTTQHSFGDDEYLFILDNYDKAGSIYTYTAIDEEGNVFEIQSKNGQPKKSDNPYAGALVTYTMDDDLYKLSLVDDEYSKGEDVARTETGADLGLVVVDRTQYVKVFDFDPDKDVDRNDSDAVKDGFTDGNGNYIRYADKALVIDVDATSRDDDTAATTEFASGQYGWVVFDENKKAVVAFVTDTYKMEADEDPDKGDNVDRDLTVVIEDSNIYVYNAEDASNSDISEAIDEALTDAGYTDIEIPFKDLFTPEAINAKKGNVKYEFTAKLATSGGTEEKPVAVDTSKGGEIILGSGVFTVGTVDEDVIIIGNGDTTIVPVADGGSAFDLKDDGKLTLKNVIISSDADTGNLIKNSAHASGTITLDDCTFEGGRIAVLVDGLNGGSITNCTFRGYAKAAISVGNSLNGELEISDNDYGTDTEETVFIEYVASVKDKITGTDLDGVDEGEYSEI